MHTSLFRAINNSKYSDILHYWIVELMDLTSFANFMLATDAFDEESQSMQSYRN